MNTHRHALRERWQRLSKLPQTGTLSIWGFGKLLKGTSAVLWRCPGTSPVTRTTFQFWSVTRAWTKNPTLLSPVPFGLSFHCPHGYRKIQWGRPSSVFCKSKLQFCQKAFFLPRYIRIGFHISRDFSNGKKTMFKDAEFSFNSKSERNVNATYVWSEHKRGIKNQYWIPFMAIVKRKLKIHITQNNCRGITINHNPTYCPEESPWIWWLTKRGILSTLADETKGWQEKEQISLLVRYY